MDQLLKTEVKNQLNKLREFLTLNLVMEYI